MDQVGKDDARENEEWEQIVSAARGGIIFVDASGQVTGLDSTAQRRLNGEAKQLKLPIHKFDAHTVDCFVSTETLDIKGVPTQVCVVQEREPAGGEVTTAMESILADTSSFARDIVDRLKLLRVAPRLASAHELDMLTDRETEILGLICRGQSDLEMSAALHLSHNTVRNHIASLYRKIGVHRRGAAILWARERGITGEDFRGRRARNPDRRGS